MWLWWLWCALGVADEVRLTGALDFFADFRTTEGQIPNRGITKVRRLYLCAYAQRGDQDLRSAGRPGDDVQLGCTSSSDDGRYELSVERPAGPVDLYLATWFCDADDAGARSPAEVCVRVNVAQQDEQLPDNRKYLWTRTYAGVALHAVRSLPLSWNLSCPARSGIGQPRVPCSADEAARQAGPSGRRNSTTGWTQEFLHAHRAAIEPVKSFGTQKPNAENTFGEPCDAASCQDEINLHIHDSLPAGAEPFYRTCQGRTAKSNNSSVHYDGICLTTPTNAFRVVHEIGHNVHRRWLRREGSISRGAECNDWNKDAEEKCATTEGWANYFAAASWFNEDDADPVYDGHDIEDRRTMADCDTAPRSEGHVAQFLWDISDDHRETGERDDVNHSVGTVRKLWGLFPPGTGDRQDDEDGVHGRNMRDWYYHYERTFPKKAARVWQVMEDNCMDRHRP